MSLLRHFVALFFLYGYHILGPTVLADDSGRPGLTGLGIHTSLLDLILLYCSAYNLN
jgi:hypothetical protein